MKRLIFILIPAVFIFFACQKETSFELGINTPASGTLKDSLGDCDSMSVNGTYTEGTALTNTNTVSVIVNVTVPGTYRIATDTVNGFSFIDSGFFSTAGTYLVTLRGSGKPILPITTDFTVTFASSFCDFSVNVGPGTSTPASDTAWMFNDGAMHFQGHFDSARYSTAGALAYLRLYGKTKTNDTTFYVQLQGPNSVTFASSFSTAAGTAVFEFKTPTGATIYESHQGDGSDLVFTITNFSSTTFTMKANFSGTAKDGAAATKTITAGKLNTQ